jgi:hypothetical protein
MFFGRWTSCLLAYKGLQCTPWPKDMPQALLYFSHGYGGQTFIRAVAQSAAEEALQASRQVGRNRRASHGTATARHPGASWELGVKQKSAGNAIGLRPATLRHLGRAVTNRPPMPGLTSPFPQIAS